MRRLAAFGLTALLLQGCATVATPPPSGAEVSPPAAWRTDAGPGVPIAQGWWRGFGDPVLDGLVDQARANNTDVLQAASRVEEARAQTRVSRAALLPTLDAGVAAGRAQSLSALGVETRSTTVEPQLTAAYEIDLFGRLRDLNTAARASLAASQATRDTTALSVAGATAQAYIVLRGLDARLLTARDTLTAREEALKIARRRATTGYTSDLELRQAQGEYEAAAQLVPQLQLAVARQETAIRLLTGQSPGDVPRGKALMDLATLPAPEGLPSDLLRRRPDIAQAEAQVAAADRSYAAARAQLLPQVRITGMIGELFVNGDDTARLWTLGGSILAPIFRGGALSAQADAAGARRDQAAWAYRKTALTAFKEAEDGLAAIRRLSEQEDHVRLQRDAAAQALRIARNRYQAGYSTYLDQLDAQRALLAADLALSQARSDRLSAWVVLYQAMGGGWNPA